jgi:hypothetical protein
MLGFKTFGNAEVTLSEIELANKIKKGQFDTSEISATFRAPAIAATQASRSVGVAIIKTHRGLQF